MIHDKSAYLSTRRAIQDAEDVGELRGIDRGIEMVAAMFEASGRAALAAEVRAAKVVERPGNAGVSTEK